MVGWDDIVDGRYSSPSLTTIASDLRILAEYALDALVRRIEGDRRPGRRLIVPHELVLRASSP